MKAPALINGDSVRDALSPSVAADALEVSLQAGLDPEAQPARMALGLDAGHLLVMPGAAGKHAMVKMITVGGHPRIQGIAVAFDAQRLAPVAMIDGVALTKLRTVAVTLVALRRMVRGPICHLVVFGRGPQGLGHLTTLRAHLTPEKVTPLNASSTTAEVAAAVTSADLIVCATTAREPLFDGDLVGDSTVVAAVGSHEPDTRELDETLLRRSTVVVESRRSALREAGDVLMAGLEGADLVTLSELVAGVPLPAGRPLVFKSTGMSWEDAVVADLLLERCALS